MQRQNINHLPEKPGVYLFRDEKGKVLYVGKAVNLKSRVRAYFRKPASFFDSKTPYLTSKISHVDHIRVESEIEALLLEANLIKKHQPKFNTQLKDDKSYLYIKITTGDDFPKVLTARREELSEATFFGPFPSAKTVRDTLRLLRRIFPYCNCNFRTCQKKSSCLEVEIGLDVGPCLRLVTKREYRQIIRRLILLLRGERVKLVGHLKKTMIKAAKKEEFEKAQVLKKQIKGIEYLTHPTISPQTYLQDPEYLAKKRQAGLRELKRILKLSQIPARIECFDVSDIQGRQATGSMVVFQEGEVDKSQYRRFKIRLEAKPNDVAMMKEVIKRRLNHPEWPRAGLIVVDGGKGQVAGARATMKETGLEIPVVGLAKRLEEIILPIKGTAGDFSMLRLPRESAALHLLQAIRDEAHRFALIYHRRLRLKNLPRNI